jgi:hypothetical protein
MLLHTTNIRDTLRLLRQTRSIRSDHECCVALHDFVRDEIRFGFTSRFESVTPEQTLELRRGHCNAKADLFRALLVEAGIPARLRFVQLNKRILLQAVPRPVYYCLPDTLFHAVTQVKVAKDWLNTDSYIFDPVTFQRQKQRLIQSTLPLGFGLTQNACCDWDASRDAFSQASASDLSKDDPVFSTLADTLADKASKNTLLGIHFNQWLDSIPGPLGRTWENYLNSRLR